MQPIRIIRVTTGKSAAYDLADDLRKRGATVTTCNVHGTVYAVKIYSEPTKA